VRTISKLAAAIAFAIVAVSTLSASGAKPARDPGQQLTGAVPRDQSLIQTTPERSSQRPSDERFAAAGSDRCEAVTFASHSSSIEAFDSSAKSSDSPYSLHQRPPPVQ